MRRADLRVLVIRGERHEEIIKDTRREMVCGKLRKEEKMGRRGVLGGDLARFL